MESIHFAIIVTNILIGIGVIAIIVFGIRFLSVASKNAEKNNNGPSSSKVSDID